MKRILQLSWPLKILAGVMIIGVVFWGYKRFFGSKTQTPIYQTATVERGTLIVSVNVSGSVATSNSASANTAVSGVVNKVFVKNGESVNMGDPLVQIDLDQSSQQKYDQAMAAYQNARNSLQSAQTNLYTLQSSLFSANQKFINDAVARELAVDDPTYIQENANWLAAEASFKNQQQVIASAQTNVNNAWLTAAQASPIIYAPISGKVDGLSLQPGAVLASSGSSSSTSTSSTKVANIKTEALPAIAISLTEIDVPKVQVGNRATITLDAFADKTFTGKVASVDTVGSVSSGVTSYPVSIILDSAVAGILPNMSATANIITQTKDNVLMVPNSAVQTANNNTIVRILKNGVVTNVTVTTGLASDSQTEITSGLSEGDTVVTGSTNTSSTTRTTSGNSVFGGGLGGGAFRTGGAVRIQGR